MSENTNKDLITLSSYIKAIVHIDCDAFFTSCEQSRTPSLKGRPLVTGKERGIISCASYEAKALGIKRGVSLRDAKKICPSLIILPSDYETYSLYSERLFAIVRRYTPDVEEFSIDEAFCDITGLRRLYRASYEDIAIRIKDDVQKELDITVSVGLSLSKTLSKIGSRYKKPNGFTALPGYKLHEFLKDIPLEMVCGFGPNTVSLLNKFNINTVLDYIKIPVAFADKLLGKIGRELWYELRGQSVYALSKQKKEKYLSISKTKTFMPSSADKDVLKSNLMKNLESACIKLRRHKLSAGYITIYLRRDDFSGVGHEARLSRHSSSTLDFTGVCAELFEMVFKRGSLYRATGVILSEIVPEGVDQRTLFDDPVKIKDVIQLSKSVDSINEKYGKHAVHIATSQYVADHAKDHPRNEVAWRKTELLKGETFRKRLNIPLLKT